MIFSASGTKLGTKALLSALMASLAVALLGVGGGGAPRAGAAVAADTPCGAGTAPPATWSHITMIIFENKPLKKIIGNTQDAPYINSIAAKCSYSARTDSLSLTSLANYIALTSGHEGCDTATSTGVCTHEKPITANKAPSVWPQASKSIFELMQNNAVQWAEDSQGNCYTGGAGLFTVTHTPFPYYTRTPALCQANARPFPTDKTQVLSAKFNLVIPNKKNIMHLVPDTTVSDRIRNGDSWLKGYLPTLLNSPTYQAGTSVILITWDEGNAKNYTVPLIVLSPSTTVGGVSTVPYDHYSTLKGVQEMLGQTTLLGHAGDVGKSSIRNDALFNLR